MDFVSELFTRLLFFFFFMLFYLVVFTDELYFIEIQSVVGWHLDTHNTRREITKSPKL